MDGKRINTDFNEGRGLEKEIGKEERRAKLQHDFQPTRKMIRNDHKTNSYTSNFRCLCSS